MAFFTTENTTVISGISPVGLAIGNSQEYHPGIHLMIVTSFIPATTFNMFPYASQSTVKKYPKVVKKLPSPWYFSHPLNETMVFHRKCPHVWGPGRCFTIWGMGKFIWDMISERIFGVKTSSVIWVKNLKKPGKHCKHQEFLFFTVPWQTQRQTASIYHDLDDEKT